MNGKRILVIEDEFLIALEIVSALEAAGFGDVEQVDNQEDALRRVGEETWDGIVADANLNGASIERIATLMKQRSIPFVVVTGYGKETLPTSVGDAPVIEKPFSWPHLAQTLIRTIGSGGC